ncbi:ABC transporter substrate-binding protein [Paenibacillus sp. 1P07SE]|uniref:ABC transporter substrate-binding protein n=1 Tax=Paenibacillus sp. 1P07SE TaxID=3132209 RepID=UPI0039A41A5F
MKFTTGLTLRQIRRGGFLLLLLWMVSLTAACSSVGGTNDGMNDRINEDATLEQQPEASATPVEEPVTREVEHAGGMTTIVGEPQNIAVLDYRLSDTLLALGIMPHAMGTYRGSTDLPYIDGEPFADVIPLGDTVNLEALIESDPDLIIGRATDSMEDLQKIASTIIAPKPDDWREGLREMGVYLDREAEAKAWLADFDQQATQLAKEIHEHIEPDATFLYLRVMAKEIRVHGPDQALAQTLFGELGLQPVAGLENVQRIEAISAESLPDFDADYIFMEVGAPAAEGDNEARDNLKNLQDLQIWQGLKAVQHDRLYEVPQWVISDYPHIKLKSLEVIREALLPQ